MKKLIGPALLAFFVSLSANLHAEPSPAAPAAPVTEAATVLEARQLATEGQLLEAQGKYKEFLAGIADSEAAAPIRKELEAVNMQLLYSKTVTPDSFLYEVKAGDNLGKIAKKNKTTVELIQKSNGIEGTKIIPGQKLKVISREFSILVNCTENKLYVKQGDEILKTYIVATGANKSTPFGEFTVETKLVDPTWFHAGAVVPPGSPENILGTRWMGLSIPGYGIHGTTLPDTIGSSSSAGCIRMLNEEAEELFNLIPLKTKVTIAE